MIWDSWYWKKPLLETANRLKTLTSIGLNKEQLTQIEKDIFIGFYSIRKLFDTPAKITDTTRETKIELSWYNNTNKEVTWLNSHKLDELYDFSKEGYEIRDAWFVSSRIIHSFVFAPLVNESGHLEGVLFNSDKDKDKRLYFLHINRIIELFELVGNDYPTEIRWQRNPTTSEETMNVK